MIRLSHLRWEAEAWEFFRRFLRRSWKILLDIPHHLLSIQWRKISSLSLTAQQSTPGDTFDWIRRCDEKCCSIQYWFRIIRTSLKLHRTHIELYTYLICASSFSCFVCQRLKGKMWEDDDDDESNRIWSDHRNVSNQIYVMQLKERVSRSDGRGGNEKLISLLLIPSITSSTHNPI